MAVTWITRELTPEQDLRAIALLRISDEGLSEEEWRQEIAAYRQAFAAGDGGLASIEDQRQCVMGLCFYKILDYPACGKVLEICRAVMPDTMAPMIAHDFVSIIEEVARTRNCPSIHIAKEAGRGFKADAMQRLLEQEFSFISPHWCRKTSPEAS
jgi:hypothetical protein